jgi:hypothetical protein
MRPPIWPETKRDIRLGNGLQASQVQLARIGYASRAFNAASMNALSAGFNPPPGRMTPNRRDWPQFGVRHLRDFELIVADAKIKVRFARHDDGPGANSAQRFCQIPVETVICTDVGMLPCP